MFKKIKNGILISLLSITAIACEQEGIYTTKTEVAPVDTTTKTTIHENAFSATSGITVKGGYEIYEQNKKHYLILKDFSVTSAPDLKVFLSNSTSDNQKDFVNLGPLDYNKTYAIPTDVNLNDYTYVLIHCQQYSHLFAIANLKNNN